MSILLFLTVVEEGVHKASQLVVAVLGDSNTTSVTTFTLHDFEAPDLISVRAKHHNNKMGKRGDGTYLFGTPAIPIILVNHIVLHPKPLPLADLLA